MANGNENLADTIYSEFEILDPTSVLAKAREVEMETLYKLPNTDEAKTLASPEKDFGGRAGVPNPGESDSTAFIQGLKGGIKDILNNTSGGGGGGPRKRRLWIDIVKLGDLWEQQRPRAQLEGTQLHQQP